MYEHGRNLKEYGFVYLLIRDREKIPTKGGEYRIAKDRSIGLGERGFRLSPFK